MRTNALSVLAVAALAVLAVGTLATSTPAPAQERTVHSFSSSLPGGSGPDAGLIADAAGNFYGVTQSDGPETCEPFDPTGCGTVFELSPKAGGGWTVTVLYNFHGEDGWSPIGGLTLDSTGNLYGTTSLGGTGKCWSGNHTVVGCGTVFELSPAGGGKWTHQILHSFQATGDGASPEAGVIFDSSGNLYGTTASGGAYYSGTVFQLTPSDGGGWTETLLHQFGSIVGDGGVPLSSLIFDSTGNLYGATYDGGIYGQGTVFEMSPGSGGNWAETVLYSFQYVSSDGQNPQGGLVFDASGNLYGTTFLGGNRGYGTVFQVTNAGGVWTERLLHSFEYSDTNHDGAFPCATLIFDGDGNLYGTTASGGSANGGSVFEMMPGESGDWRERVLHSFGSQTGDGWQPHGNLIFDNAGNLYGTTVFGGDYSSGTVFEVKQ